MAGARVGVCHAVSDEPWIQWLQESLPAEYSSDHSAPLPQNIRRLRRGGIPPEHQSIFQLISSISEELRLNAFRARAGKPRRYGCARSDRVRNDDAHNVAAYRHTL